MMFFMHQLSYTCCFKAYTMVQKAKLVGLKVHGRDTQTSIVQDV